MGKHRRKVPAYPEEVRAAMRFFKRKVDGNDLTHFRNICNFMAQGMREFEESFFSEGFVIGFNRGLSALTDAPAKPPG